MKRHDVEIQKQGQTVSVRIRARSLKLAQKLHRFTERHQIEGYILLAVKMSRRRVGGRQRWVRLTFSHTGNLDFPPMREWQEWDIALDLEQQIAIGATSLAIKSAEEAPALEATRERDHLSRSARIDNPPTEPL